MNYFSGFCLQNEDELFEDWLIRNDYTVAGFSYGAILALEYCIRATHRVDRLLLFSPAFFQNKRESFINLQINSYKKNPKEYRQTFLSRAIGKANIDLNPYIKVGTLQELEELLRYRWEISKLETLIKKGIVIEIFLGKKDQIIDAKRALEFFSPIVSATYLFQNAGHFLKIEK